MGGKKKAVDTPSDNDDVESGLPAKWSKGSDAGAPQVKSKQEQRDEYKALKNSKAKGKTEKGGEKRWASWANDV